MSATATVSQTDIQRINAVIKAVAKSARQIKGYTRQAMVFALQSAAKATKPGSGAKVSTLPRKYKLRPVERMPDTAPFWYRWISKSGGTGIFRSETKIRKRKDIAQITRGIKYWNKKKNGWDFIPFEGGPGKYHPQAKGAKIPGSGYAKLGWLQSLGKLGKATEPVPARVNLSVFRQVENADEVDLSVDNVVSYIRRTSPQSAEQGIAAARKRIEKIYLPRIAREIEARANA